MINLFVGAVKTEISELSEFYVDTELSYVSGITDLINYVKANKSFH